jgi:diadenosine tetraphosphate (Ap4A) HIT family hydrolase
MKATGYSGFVRCEYCEWAKEESDLITETRYWKVFLSDEQSYLGRCVILLKRHCESVSDINEAEWDDLHNEIKGLEKTMKKAFGATMFNLTCLMNNAYKKKPYHPHVHWHFRPRYDNKVKFAGLVFDDSRFGHHYDPKSSRKLDSKTRNLIINRIKKNLS